MKQFLLPAALDLDGRTELRGKDYHYLVRVRRLVLGDELVCRTLEGTQLNMRVSSIQNEILVLENLGTSIPSYELPAKIQLIQCLTKSVKMDQIVRQACELGVTNIHIAPSQHSQIEKGENPAKRLERWEKIAKEAFQQSGQAKKTEILMHNSLNTAIQSLKTELVPKSCKLYCHEKALNSTGLGFHLQIKPQEVFIVIGPEGGLSGQETSMLDENLYNPLWLGPGVLRAETAAVAALASVRQFLLEDDRWAQKYRQ